MRHPAILKPDESRQPQPQPTHIYSSLTSDSSIRLLELQPGAPSQPIECRLFIVDLASDPIYEAISYEWGDPSKTTSITCDGKHRSVRMNLELALRSFRKPSESRVLWIDALCINQDDDMEKSHQVAMMGDIYRKAKTGLAWLGPDPQDQAQSACELMTQIVSVVTEHAKSFPISQLPRIKPDHPIFETNESWNSLQHFSELTYFRRTWIVQ